MSKKNVVYPNLQETAKAFETTKMCKILMKERKTKTIEWGAIGASDDELSKNHPKTIPHLNDVNVLHSIGDEGDKVIIRNQDSKDVQFVISSSKNNGMSKHCEINVSQLVDTLRNFPKTLVRANSRGLGLEFGFYCMVGAINKGGNNMRNGIPKPLLRKPTTHPKTQIFQNDTLIPILNDMWQKVEEYFPNHSKFALDRTPPEFRYPKNTGFSKVTVALNNGTPYHYDKHNLHGSMTAILILCDEGVIGGEQIIEENGDAMVVKTTHGLLIIGDYTHMRHAVFPVLDGNRVAIIGYSMEKVYKYSKNTPIPKNTPFSNTPKMTTFYDLPFELREAIFKQSHPDKPPEFVISTMDADERREYWISIYGRPLREVLYEIDPLGPDGNIWCVFGIAQDYHIPETPDPIQFMEHLTYNQNLELINYATGGAIECR